MAALFEVHRAVNLKDRYLFALVGVIEEGMVHTGMEASLTDDEDAPKFEGKVHGVEFVGAEGIIPETHAHLPLSGSGKARALGVYRLGREEGSLGVVTSLTPPDFATGWSSCFRLEHSERTDDGREGIPYPKDS